LIYPEGDAIRERVHNRYSLVVLAAKRAKQIKEGAPVLIETSSTNPLTIALEEIAVGKVTFTEAVEPDVDDEVTTSAESAKLLNAPSERDFLSVSPSAGTSSEQTAATLPPELAAFLPANEAETLPENEPVSGDKVDDKESIELTGKAQP